MELSCPTPLPHRDRIVMGHGGGGRLTAELIRELFYPLLENPTLLAADDAALPPDRGAIGDDASLAVSTDAHIVHPLIFPGGDIGRLAVCGTVNDLAMVGAQPLWITASFILEEGLSTETLQTVVRSMREAADEAGVQVVAGDTKVAERGKVDGIYISTTGIGRVPDGRMASSGNARPGDAVLLSGTLGDHGIAVLAARGELAFETEIVSDVAPLSQLVEAMYATGADIRVMRDPTRGGLSAALNEIAVQSDVAVVLKEDRIPVRQAVEAACELLGFDPLFIANEGKLVAFVPDESAGEVLQAMQAEPNGVEACLIGRVEASPAGKVFTETAIGGTRIVDVPAGEILPRIC